MSKELSEDLNKKQVLRGQKPIRTQSPLEGGKPLG